MGELTEVRDLHRPSFRLVHWHVIFVPPSTRHWWDRFLEPGFGHVYAIRWDGWNWIIVNPRLDTVLVDTSAYSYYSLRDLVIGEATEVLSVTAQVPIGRLRSPWHVGPITCVELVKGLLGIRAFWVRTPRQLYRYMRAQRGTVLKAKSTRPHRRGKGLGAPPA